MERKVKEEQRIEREAAEKYPETRYDRGGHLDDTIYSQKRVAYIAGATKEAERCNQLVLALITVQEHLILGNTKAAYTATTKALQDYNQNK